MLNLDVRAVRHPLKLMKREFNSLDADEAGIFVVVLVNIGYKQPDLVQEQFGCFEGNHPNAAPLDTRKEHCANAQLNPLFPAYTLDEREASVPRGADCYQAK